MKLLKCYDRALFKAAVYKVCSRCGLLDVCDCVEVLEEVIEEIKNA